MHFKRRILATLALAGTTLLSGCASWRNQDGWETLIDGLLGRDNFYSVGVPAEWWFIDGTIATANPGRTPAFLVSHKVYGDFELRAEFWASDDANTGIFMRCQQPLTPGDETCYEANIYDQRPDKTYATGAIVKVAPVKADPLPKAGGRWNSYDIMVKGDHMVVVFNGIKTVDVRDNRFASGPIALQWANGLVKWRKLKVRPIVPEAPAAPAAPAA